MFFLVDPTTRIISTARVPPQDPSWNDTSLQQKVKERIPVEIASLIEKQLGYQMSLEEAKIFRLELMEERSVAKDAVTR